MKWIEIAIKYCTFILMSSLERKESIFNVKYEIVLRTPYSKARCPPTPTPITTIWSAVRDFFWVACLTLDIQQRLGARSWSYNPIQLLFAFSLLLLKNRQTIPPCVLERILHKKKAIFIQTLESPIPSYGPHFDNHEKGMKYIFEALYNEISLSIKKTNFNERNGSKFSYLLMVRAEGAAPPP